MGGLVSRIFGRKEVDFIEERAKELEELEINITKTKKLLKEHTIAQTNYLRKFLALSAIIYIAIALWLYFVVPMGSSFNSKLVHILPVLFFPVLAYFLRKIVAWFFARRIAKDEALLTELFNKQQETIEEIKHKTAYERTEHLLSRFGGATPETAPSQSQSQAAHSEGLRQRGRQPGGSVPRPIVDSNTRVHPSSANMALRQRSMDTAVLHGSTPLQQQHNAPHTTPHIHAHMPQSQAQSQHRSQLRGGGLGTPAPVSVAGVTPGSHWQGSRLGGGGTPLMREPSPSPMQKTPSLMDRIVEYIVGEGAGNRLALICANCHRHNGMVLQEEADVMIYTCVYCGFLNKPASYGEGESEGESVGEGEGDDNVQKEEEEEVEEVQEEEEEEEEEEEDQEITVTPRRSLRRSARRSKK